MVGISILGIGSNLLPDIGRLQAIRCSRVGVDSAFLAHQKLDTAVFAAYDWPTTLSDDELLAKLLTLNLKRAEKA